MAKHALLPPSSADKWMVCTSWLQAVKGLESRSSIYADEGTKAHEVLEWSLRLGVSPFEMTEDLDLADNLSVVTDWLEAYYEKNPKADHLIENTMPWGHAIGRPGLAGTSDLAVIAPRELVITDYKHGAGVIVDPKTSKQLRLYLLGLIHKVGPRKKYRLVIFQPRAYGVQPVREHTVTHDEIMKFREEARDAADKNFSGKGTRKAGDHCRFCAAAPKCRTLAEHALKIAVQEFDS